jgi:hypothetical protein
MHPDDLPYDLEIAVISRAYSRGWDGLKTQRFLAWLAKRIDQQNATQ